MTVRAKRITPENFAKFGSVVSAPKRTPTAEAAEYKFWSDITHYLIDGETEIGICTVYRQLKMEISGVERHLHTPEILIPIDAPFILPLHDEQANEPLEAFKVHVGEAVVVAKGVWHGACLPIGRNESSYFVIFRRNTPDEDVAKKVIQPILLEV
jgi:ureidoglycolate hydrolase